MSYCINPNCPNPTNPDNTIFCQACGSELLIEGQFRVVQPLGTGGFATTYEVEEDGVAEVLKVLTLNNDKAIALFKQEAEVLQQLNHPGIPNVDAEGYFTYTPRDTPDPVHCIVMEKIEGENLEEWLEKRGNRPISQKLALKWLRQLVDILQEVHQKNFFHRDIKPSNIMLRPDGQLALIDFGTVKEITATFLASQNERGTVLYSRGYAPIEQENGHTVPQSDFFALGRTFVHLLTGKHPLDMYDPYTSQLQWQNQTEDIHPDLIAFLEQLMARLYRDRPENTQILLQQLDQLEQRIHTPPPVSATVSSSSPSSPPSSPPKSKSSSKPPILIAGGSVLLLALLAGLVFWPRRNPLPSSQLANATINLSHGATVLDVTIPPSGEQVISSSYDKQIKLWDINTGKLDNTFSEHSGRVNSITLAQGKLASGGGGGTIRLWDLDNNQQTQVFSGSNRVLSVAISPDGQTLASGDNEGQIILRNMATGEVLTTLKAHTAQVNSLVFSPTNANLLVSASHDATVKVWDITQGGNEPQFTLEDNTDRVYSVAISPDGTQLASGSYDEDIRLWNLATGELEKTLKGHAFVVSSLDYSRDGRRLVSGSYDEDIRVWNLATGKPEQILSGHEGFVYGVAFHPNNQQVVSGGYDGTVRLWDVQNGQQVQVFGES